MSEEIQKDASSSEMEKSYELPDGQVISIVYLNYLINSEPEKTINYNYFIKNYSFLKISLLLHFLNLQSCF